MINMGNEPYIGTFWRNHNNETIYELAGMFGNRYEFKSESGEKLVIQHDDFLKTMIECKQIVIEPFQKVIDQIIA